jgi:hypothetical protein
VEKQRAASGVDDDVVEASRSSGRRTHGGVGSVQGATAMATPS